MCVSSTMKNVLSGGKRDAGLGGDRRRRPRDRVGGAPALLVPVGALQELLLVGVDEVAALLLQLREEAIVDRRVDEQVAVGRAARAVVVGLADARVARRLFDVGGLVDDHRRVAGADAVGRLARAVGRLHHRRPAGGDGEIADRHQLVGQRDARPLDALQHVSGTPSAASAARISRTVSNGRLAARRMRREDDRVLALDRVDGDADRRDVRAGHRDQRADHAGRLRVFDDALLGNLLDDRPCSSGAARRAGCRAPCRGGSARGRPCRSRRRSCWRGGSTSPGSPSAQATAWQRRSTVAWS